MVQFKHQPVLLKEVVAALAPRPNGRYVDATIGGGGHAEGILQASSPSGWLFGSDRDGAAIVAASERLAAFSGRFELRQANFAELATWVPASSCDGVLMDLGVSSFQLEQPGRGFSFQTDGPLDMRMDVRQPLTAADLVNAASAAELGRIFQELGGEPAGRRVARAIVGERQQRPFRTTRQLAGLIERLAPRRGRATHPATRCFVGLRMRVNDELGALERGMAAAWTVLKPTGRLAIITFCSAEDRMVKAFGRGLVREYLTPGGVDVPELRQPRPALGRWLGRKPVCAGLAEVAANPRARSAQLRVLEKLRES